MTLPPKTPKRWTDVREKVPDDHTRVLGFLSDPPKHSDDRIFIVHRSEQHWRYNGAIVNVLLWMELPAWPEPAEVQAYDRRHNSDPSGAWQQRVELCPHCNRELTILKEWFKCKLHGFLFNTARTKSRPNTITDADWVPPEFKEEKESDTRRRAADAAAATALRTTVIQAQVPHGWRRIRNGFTASGDMVWNIHDRAFESVDSVNEAVDIYFFLIRKK